MSDQEKFQKGAKKFEEVIGFAPPASGPDFLKITVENLFADVPIEAEEIEELMQQARRRRERPARKQPTLRADAG